MLGRLLHLLLGWVPADLFDIDLGDVDEGPTCGYLGCTNPVDGAYDWQMCDTCYTEACDAEDSEWGDDYPLKLVKFVPAPPDDSEFW